MDTTPNLALPYIIAAQAQKHVTHNEAIRRLDVITQIAVLDRNAASPPATPADGDRYIVAASPTGAWASHANHIAAWQDNAWEFYVPREGWLAWIADEDALLVWNGSAWLSASSGGSLPESVPRLGINATPDNTNRLSVSSPATLLDHSGAGHQLKINKASAGDTASLLWQSGFSGRGEIGLAGNDDLSVKVSADGTLWRDAMLVDRATGEARFPSTPTIVRPNLLLNGDFQVNQRAFPGGALAAAAYGYDRWKADTGGATCSVSGFVVTLASGAIVQVIEPSLFGEGSLAARSVTVSVANLAGGSLAITAGSASGTITPGSGRRSVALTLGAGDSGNVILRLAPQSAAVSFERVKLELGGYATAWSPRVADHERRLCQRYYFETTAEIIGSGLTYDVYTGDPNTYDPFLVPFPAEMRVPPTATRIGTFTPVNIFTGDQPLTIATSRTAGYLRARGAAVGRRYVACSTGARLTFSAEL